MRQEEVDRCQIQEWYPKFKLVSIKTHVHRLPESFVEYLLGDTGPFVLPNSVTGEDALPNRVCNLVDEDYLAVSEESGDESEEFPPPSFPELELEVKESIESLGGAIFPKLNWSSPKDAAWISGSGNLRCTSLSEIALLLRASDSSTHDLCHAYDSCSNKSLSRPQSFFLALRKWQPALRPEMEFRCFVRNKLLVGICQREVTTFYPVLLEKKEHLKVLIEDFFESEVRPNFESDNYAFDVYVTKDGRVKVLDFNPWGVFTLPLLFSWDELSERDDEEVDFRIVESRCAVRPGLKTAVPYDYLDTSPGSGWDQFLRNADEEIRKQAKESPEAGA
ncbi:cell division cycle protein 123 homolog [Rhodamnia argentea]|uniref:Cell division cycle protein 123 homolog n=1 Tax=Rhodamnia argentea TaxID=178133 RepID=A0A8B8Q7T2_9MYRT|nr:cell division cycle protein 123 homolog [Rhodamnia argentea]XP_048138270.1 cell division cycle protein 123 homolog [Rhodamnia argentea]XP_048138271.1 cell division cycle protein 123 homolog [Rhodamnia argentea]